VAATGEATPPPALEAGQLGVRLLGGLQIRVAGEPLESLRSARARSLLGFLVLHADAAHTRQRLAFEFWPDSSDSQARTNLRNLIHTLRQAHPLVDESLHVTSTALQWRPAGPTRVDVDAFTDAARTALGADPDDAEEVIARCRAAVALYGGELLAGDHDEWMLAPREALRDQYRDVLRLLATALIDDGRALEATAVARELVRADPLDESTHRLRIEAHHAAGDRAGAVRAYHECAATLERELSVEPGPVTAAAYAAVLESGAAAGVRPEPTARARPDLVGREQEWQQLVAAWRGAEQAPPGVVLVTGEPGIGKTRLVEELRAWCARSGARIGEARSYATEGDLGLAVVAAWLRSPDIQAGLAQLPKAQRAELARLLPELGSSIPADRVDDAEHRRRIFDAAAAAIAGSGQPTLLVADDCQWSDQISQEFIHYLVRQPLHGPLLVVLTARREEVDGGHPLTALRDSLTLLGRLTELRLERLSREATGEMGGQLAGSHLDPATIEALFAETEGNPLFVVETMRAGWDGLSGPAPLTPRLRAVIDARFNRLSPVASAILGAMSVVGRPCSPSLLATVCDIGDSPLASGLDELWRRGILEETGTDSYEFSHSKLRDAAYEDLSPAMRRSLHGSIARALSELVGREPSVASSHLALHFEAANRPEEAVAWFQKAALDAQRVAAYAEAVRLLDRALALLPALPADTRHGRELELLSSMPPAIAGAEGYVANRMHEAHRRAAGIAARLGVDLDPAVTRSMVMSALCRDEFGEAARTASRLLEHAEAGGDVLLRMESHYLLGIAAFWAAHLEDAHEHFELVVTDFDPATRARHHEIYGHDPQVVCFSRLANTLCFLGREDEARRTCDDALALADEVGHPLSHATAAIFSCMLAVDLHDGDLLRRFMPRLGALGMDSLPFATKYEAFLGLVDVLDGRHAPGLARIRAALDRCEGRNFYPGFQAAILRLLVAAQVHAGDTGGGLEACSRALAMRSTPLWEAELQRVRAEFLHESGAGAGEIEAALRAAETVARGQRAAGHVHRIEHTRRRLGLAISAAPS
jgi:DNA-binding SARP family transcriptional activator